MSEGRENSVSPMKGEMSSSGGLLGHEVHALWFMWPQQSGFSGSKVSACNAGYLGSISESGRSPGEGNGNPLQYSCLENSMDGGAW